MARKRKASSRFGTPVVMLAAGGFIAAVFAAGLWAGMQFGQEPPAPRQQEAVMRSPADKQKPPLPVSPGPADQAAMDRLVARVAEPEKAPAPEVKAVAQQAPRLRPDAEAPAQLAWVQNALPTDLPSGRPMIALVIDDVGIDRRRSDAIVALPGPLTLSYLTYAKDLDRQTAAARAGGHELMVHMPMQPKSADADPGPNVLRVRDKPVDLAKKIDWGLSRFGGYVGVNNHMGSRFTSDRAGMNAVMEALKLRGLFFLDSVTAPDTAGPAAAEALGVPVLKRDVFLDNEDSPEEVRYRLEQVEKIARKSGAAIAIGHPHDATITVLRDWIPDAKARGFAIVPITVLVRRRYPALWQSAGRS
ncbi:divergent polysaccharide deacetylase family protein [Nisaea acidiphila]|uniref:Divergent polysaccharide deacetylase family protein n=1 Tax=Nisaea acidiphila TaxID=1862145 RepID=A0A9J7AY43_9PROT|nr:divergent polysaccharide deacetylase family protein [Nisaea acidiphila]UUX50349.1 divergent polysaccharide deacetylase family protein [Nisaea acidiphila]